MLGPLKFILLLLFLFLLVQSLPQIKLLSRKIYYILSKFFKK